MKDTVFVIQNDAVRRNCLMEIQTLPFGKYEVVIREKKRTNRANNLYWKWVGIIAGVLGYDTEFLHESFKRNFIGVEEKTSPFGEVLKVAKSSRNLTKGAFSEFMTKVEIFAHSERITLPSPSYYGFENPVPADSRAVTTDRPLSQGDRAEATL